LLSYSADTCFRLELNFSVQIVQMVLLIGVQSTPAIIEYKRASVIMYNEPKKCPYCNCLFLTNMDYEAHVSFRHWRRSKNDVWEWMPAKDAPHIVQRIKVSGEFTDGVYTYRLSEDDALIFRRRINKLY